MINIKVRLKNPVFWTTLIPAVLALVYTILGLFDITPTVSQNSLVNAMCVVVSALTTLGVLVDPTTAGLSDSNRAMTYSEPYRDTEDNSAQEYAEDGEENLIFKDGE